MRISGGEVTRLACRVMARVPVRSPFSLFSHRESHLKQKEPLCTDILAREELYQDVMQRHQVQSNFSSTGTYHNKY